jgi:hypothetical protein
VATVHIIAAHASNPKIEIQRGKRRLRRPAIGTTTNVASQASAENFAEAAVCSHIIASHQSIETAPEAGRFTTAGRGAFTGTYVEIQHAAVNTAAIARVAVR